MTIMKKNASNQSRGWLKNSSNQSYGWWGIMHKPSNKNSSNQSFGWPMHKNASNQSGGSFD